MHLILLMEQQGPLFSSNPSFLDLLSLCLEQKISLKIRCWLYYYH
jgi:hypothetical protein